MNYPPPQGYGSPPQRPRTPTWIWLAAGAGVLLAGSCGTLVCAALVVSARPSELRFGPAKGDATTASVVTATEAGITPAADGDAAVGDDADLENRCASVRSSFHDVTRLVVMRCESPFKPADHIVVRVTVGRRAWQSATGTERALVAASSLEAMKPHWQTFHAWSGEKGSPNRVEIIADGATVAKAFGDGRFEGD